MAPSSLADYCREVEAYLTRVNGGHLVRVVGPGFALVKAWEADGVPLSIVLRAIDEKAARHTLGAGGRGRPLRIEFCADDVQRLFDDWKRAVGVAPLPEAPEAAEAGAAVDVGGRRPTLSKHLERVSERLSRLLGRQDLPEAFLDHVTQVITIVAGARERAYGARGAARDAVAPSLRGLDAPLIAAARTALGPDSVAHLDAQAALELAAFRDRLDADAWAKAMAATSARLVRDRLGLPVIDPDGV